MTDRHVYLEAWSDLMLHLSGGERAAALHRGERAPETAVYWDYRSGWVLCENLSQERLLTFMALVAESPRYSTLIDAVHIIQGRLERDGTESTTASDFLLRYPTMPDPAAGRLVVDTPRYRHPGNVFWVRDQSA